MYNKTIISFGFYDIRNNQGHSKCYQPRPSAWLITLTLALIIPDVTKTSYNNCLKSAPHPITLTPGGGPEGLPCPPFPPLLP